MNVIYAGNDQRYRVGQWQQIIVWWALSYLVEHGKWTSMNTGLLVGWQQVANTVFKLRVLSISSWSLKMPGADALGHIQAVLLIRIPVYQRVIRCLAVARCVNGHQISYRMVAGNWTGWLVFNLSYLIPDYRPVSFSARWLRHWVLWWR